MKADRLSWLLFAALAGCDDGDLPRTTPAPPPPEMPAVCDGPSLEVTLVAANDAAGTARGELALDAADPATALDFVRPYAIVVPAGGANLDIPGLSPTVGVFVSGLRYESTESGFRQTMNLEWLGELVLRAAAPDCAPVVVSCDTSGCVSGPGPTDG